MIRALLTVGLIVPFLSGCQAPQVSRAERRHLDYYPLSSATVTVICELRYYAVGDLIGPSPLKIIRNDGKDVVCSVDKPFRLVQQASSSAIYEVRGFVFQIAEPSEFSGHVLTAHFDGVGGSGDPFKAFAYGTLYEIAVPPPAIDDLSFKLCY